MYGTSVRGNNFLASHNNGPKPIIPTPTEAPTVDHSPLLSQLVVFISAYSLELEQGSGAYNSPHFAISSAVGHRVISRMTKDLVYEESGVNKGVGAPARQTSQRASK
jgi:hypothetical protein